MAVSRASSRTSRRNVLAALILLYGTASALPTMMLLTARGRVRRRKAWSQVEKGAPIRCGIQAGR
jgi:hypothetical protein